MTATTTDPRAKLPDTPLSGNEALKNAAIICTVPLKKS